MCIVAPSAVSLINYTRFSQVMGEERYVAVPANHIAKLGNAGDFSIAASDIHIVISDNERAQNRQSRCISGILTNFAGEIDSYGIDNREIFSAIDCGAT